MPRPRTDRGSLAGGILFLTIAGLSLHTAISGDELLPPLYLAAGFVIAALLIPSLRSTADRPPPDRPPLP